MKTLPSISCTQSFKLVFKNYVKFNGRSRRSEFFYFYTIISPILYILFLLYTILTIKDAKVTCTFSGFSYEFDLAHYQIYFWLALIIMIITFLPLLGLKVRRLHDTGNPGFLILISVLIPIFGEMILLCLWCMDSEKKENKYGPSPKYVMKSGNVFQENNYIPPHRIYAMPNPAIIPVKHQRQNPILPKGISNPQHNQILNQEPPNMDQNPITPESMNIPQSNNILPQNTPYSHINPIQPVSEYDDAYASLNDPDSKSNPFQPSTDNYYNSSAL